MNKIIFISRHDLPTNLSDLLKGSAWDGAPIQHITDAVTELPVSNGDLVIAVAPDSLKFQWVAEAFRKCGERDVFTLASLNMRRVRPIEGQPSLPPTEVESLDCLQVKAFPAWVSDMQEYNNYINTMIPCVSTFRMGGAT